MRQKNTSKIRNERKDAYYAETTAAQAYTAAPQDAYEAGIPAASLQSKAGSYGHQL